MREWTLQNGIINNPHHTWNTTNTYGTEIAMPSTDNGELRKDFPGGWENDSINAFYDFGLNEIESEAKTL